MDDYYPRSGRKTLATDTNVKQTTEITSETVMVEDIGHKREKKQKKKLDVHIGRDVHETNLDEEMEEMQILDQHVSDNETSEYSSDEEKPTQPCKTVDDYCPPSGRKPLVTKSKLTTQITSETTVMTVQELQKKQEKFSVKPDDKNLDMDSDASLSSSGDERSDDEFMPVPYERISDEEPHSASRQKPAVKETCLDDFESNLLTLHKAKTEQEIVQKVKKDKRKKNSGRTDNVENFHETHIDDGTVFSSTVVIHSSDEGMKSTETKQSKKKRQKLFVAATDKQLPKSYLEDASQRCNKLGSLTDDDTSKGKLTEGNETVAGVGGKQFSKDGVQCLPAAEKIFVPESNIDEISDYTEEVHDVEHEHLEHAFIERSVKGRHKGKKGKTTAKSVINAKKTEIFCSALSSNERTVEETADSYGSDQELNALTLKIPQRISKYESSPDEDEWPEPPLPKVGVEGLINKGNSTTVNEQVEVSYDNQSDDENFRRRSKQQKVNLLVNQENEYTESLNKAKKMKVANGQYKTVETTVQETNLDDDEELSSEAEEDMQHEEDEALSSDGEGNKPQETNLDDDDEELTSDGEIKGRGTTESSEIQLRRQDIGRISHRHSKRRDHRLPSGEGGVPRIPFSTYPNDVGKENEDVSSEDDHYGATRVSVARIVSGYTDDLKDEDTAIDSQHTQNLRRDFEKEQDAIRRMFSVSNEQKGISENMVEPRKPSLSYTDDSLEQTNARPTLENSGILNASLRSQDEMSGRAKVSSRNSTSRVQQKVPPKNAALLTSFSLDTSTQSTGSRKQRDAHDDSMEVFTTTRRTTTKTTNTVRKSRSSLRSDTRGDRSLSTEAGFKRVSSDVNLIARRRHRSRRPRSVSFGEVRTSSRYVVHYDRPDVELKPLAVPQPKLTLEQVAMQTLTSRTATQTRLHAKKPSKPDERPIVYTRGIYRPQPVYWRGTSESQGFSFLHDTSQSKVDVSLGDHLNGTDLDATGSDPNPDMPPKKTPDAVSPGNLNQSDSTPGSEHKSAFVPVGSKRASLRKPRRSRYVTAPASHPEPPRKDAEVLEPGPVNFNQYGIVAKMWMEYVDIKTVMKSKTMYLSMMPAGSKPPEQLLRTLKCEPADADVPNWVMVRERSRRQLKRRQIDQQRMSQSYGVESDLDISLGMRPSSPGGHCMMLFFQVGERWKDLAWALFDDVQTDAETVRMIADIELKNPGKLSAEIQDLMARWWRRKGVDATVDKLRETLDLIGITYVQEDCAAARPSFSTSFACDSEPEELDVGEVADADPNVSRLMRNYKVRSLNASFNPDHASTSFTSPPSGDSLVRQMHRKGLVSDDDSVTYSGSVRSRARAARSRNSSVPRQSSRNSSFRAFSSQDSLTNADMADDDANWRASVRKSRLASEDYNCESNI